MFNWNSSKLKYLNHICNNEIYFVCICEIYKLGACLDWGSFKRKNNRGTRFK